MPDADEWKKAAEIAAIVRVDPGTIHRYARSGAIPCVRLSRRVVRFRLDDVLQAMRARAARAPRELRPDGLGQEGGAE
jgi:predicted site-specific integrase-resolvase